MAAHQALLSLGFSRQEHWSGLPFPFPMHESENSKWSSSVMSDSSDPMDWSLPGSSIHGIFQAKVLEWGAIAFSDKTSRLMMKSSTVKNTWRCSQNYMEKRRGRREIEVTRSRRGGIKRGESKLASNRFPVCSPQSGPLGEVHGVRRRREEGRRRRRWPGGEKGEWKGERQIQALIRSLSVLHSPEHTKRFTELGREKKGEGGDRSDLVETKQSHKGEKAIKPVITPLSKNGYWRLDS